MLLSKIKQFIAKQIFFPDLFLGLFFNPFYFARRNLLKHIKDLAFQIHGNLLDIGCGEKPYKSLFSFSSYSGLEIDTQENRKHSKADFFYKGDQFPFNGESFDSIVSFQVFEHVFNPEIFFSEVQRVLKPDGKFLLTVPFVWDEHLKPFDFARYTSFGLRALLERHGFEIIEYRKSLNDFRVIFQIIAMYWYKKLITQSPYFNVLLYVFFFGPLNFIGLLSSILPVNNDFYLDNIVLAKKKSIVKSNKE